MEGPGDVSTYVLVHGGRMGGWAWQCVARQLRTFGHKVYTPTLTGLGDRAHLLNPTINLDTHVADILALLSYEDLHEVLLVGHSYGGMVISAVYSSEPQRVAGLIYFDALLPKAGECAYDLMEPETAARLRLAVETSGDGWRIPALYDNHMSDATNASDIIEWINARLTDQPMRTYEQSFQGFSSAATSGTFVRCIGPPTIPRHVVERVNQHHAWRYREIDAPHLAPLLFPDATVDVLLDCNT